MVIFAFTRATLIRLTVLLVLGVVAVEHAVEYKETERRKTQPLYTQLLQATANVS